MLKFFRSVRKKLLSGSKVKRYLVYASGEIILVVIGILIALSINNWNENRKQSALELRYLKEMKTDLYSDIFLYKFLLPRLRKATADQEAALSTQDIGNLPLDSLQMIVRTIDLDHPIRSTFTYDKMGNLGLTDISPDFTLNYRIGLHFNYFLGHYKRVRTTNLADLHDYTVYLRYGQNTVHFIDPFTDDLRHTFPALREPPDDGADTTRRRKNLIDFIRSPKGSELILNRLAMKRVSEQSMRRLLHHTIFIYYSCHREIKRQHPRAADMRSLPPPYTFTEIKLPVDSLSKYTGSYRMSDETTLTVFRQGNQLKTQLGEKEPLDIFAAPDGAFFAKEAPVHLNFRKTTTGSIDTLHLLSTGDETTGIRTSP